MMSVHFAPTSFATKVFQSCIARWLPSVLGLQPGLSGCKHQEIALEQRGPQIFALLRDMHFGLATNTELFNEDYSTFQVDSPSSSPPRGVESTVPVQEYGHGLGLELLESASRWRHSQSLSLTQRTPSICLHLVGCIKYKIDRC
ncbi:hypothetical protein PC120_g3210 [Phytophthora cactorum]|nr:hypothetical protein PC120_g3210 [Phytophthora cactorum]